MTTKQPVLAGLRSAYSHIILGEDQAAIEAAGSALSAAEWSGIQELYELDRGTLEILLNFAWRNQLNTDFVRKLSDRHFISLNRNRAGSGELPRLTVFNRPAITQNGKTVYLDSSINQQPMRLIYKLLDSGGHKQHMDVLKRWIWRGMSPMAQDQKFYAAVFRLQSVLGNNIVNFENKFLKLNLRGCRVDVVSYCELMKTLEQSEQLDSAVLEKRIEQALAQYRKVFMLNKRNVDRFPEIAAGSSKRIEITVLNHADNLKQKNKLEKAIDYYNLALSLDPLDTQIYARLLKCFSQMGQHHDMEMLYRDYMQLNNNEDYSGDPDPIQILYRRLSSKANAA